MFSNKLFLPLYIAAVCVLWCEGAPPHNVPHCGPNEMFYNESYCDPSCAARERSPHAHEVCSVGCRCIRGYVRDSYDLAAIFPLGSCIDSNDCMIIE